MSNPGRGVSFIGRANQIGLRTRPQEHSFRTKTLCPRLVRAVLLARQPGVSGDHAMYSSTLSQREIASLRLDCLREASTNTFASEVSDATTQARLRRAKAFADFVLEGQLPGESEEPTSED